MLDRDWEEMAARELDPYEAMLKAENEWEQALWEEIRRMDAEWIYGEEEDLILSK